MGTGFSIDTPMHVARYGIASVISLVDDELIEQMRGYHSNRLGMPYTKINGRDEDARARRITAYLDLVHDVVERQVEELQSTPFVPGSEISRYYEMLPECSLKRDYQEMLACDVPEQRENLEQKLRESVQPGGIDVNIMTKLDRRPYRNGQQAEQIDGDAMAALRGFAGSKVSSSVVFSAGLNTHLYGYLAEFPDFVPGEDGISKKTVTLKVSDYRSAWIQGRYLARHGIWVSEFRVESGLNCGGHAFATKGFLMGPILEEFKDKFDTLVEDLHKEYNKGLTNRSLPEMSRPRDVLLTVQGGIGTATEHHSLLRYYRVDRTGWATPFLLVPEVTNVDNHHLDLMCEAGEGDVALDNGSPLGIPFWNLRTSSSEDARKARIESNKPGSSCPKGYLEICDDFSEIPMCRASRGYQTLKLADLEKQEMSEKVRSILRDEVLAKACICHELGGGAAIKYGLDSEAKTAVCPNLNIIHFKSVATLEQMVGHIYGRLSLIADSERSHMFISELRLYVDHLYEELDRFAAGIRLRKLSYYIEFKENLLKGIQYYQEQFRNFVSDQQDGFVQDLVALKEQLERLRVDAFA